VKYVLTLAILLCAIIAGAPLSSAGPATDSFCEIHAEAQAALKAPKDDAEEGGHKETGDAHGALRLYGAFLEKHPDAPEAALVRVLRGFIAWRELDNLDAAAGDFAAAAAASGDSIIFDHASTLGRRWLARLRMERIARACHAYFIEEVEYPAKLDELVEADLLSEEHLTDPWGDAFEYEATEHELLGDIPRQRYELGCKHIEGNVEDLRKLLKQTETFAESVRLQNISAGEQATVMVRFDGKPHVISEGKTKAGLTPLVIQPGRVIISTIDFIAVLSR
jgi:hypothetical protein